MESPAPALRPPDVGLRLAMMLLDHVIFSALVAFLVVPFWFFWIFQSMGTLQSEEFPVQMFDKLWILMIPYVLAIAFYLNKDALDGRSPGKRIIKARVINVRTGETAGPLRCFVRNLTLWFWPVEALLVLINQDRRRVGDYLAGTQVVMRNPEEQGGRIQWGAVLLSYGSAVALMAAVMVPFFFLFQKITSQIPTFPTTPSSGYQEERSWDLEPDVRRALGENAELETLRVYERGAPVPGWFVEVNVSVDEDRVDDQDLHNSLRTAVRAVLEEQLSDLPVQGRIRLRAGARFRSIIL